METKELLESIVKLLDEKKAQNIVSIDVGSKSSIADYFVIAGAGSNTLVRALGEHLEEKLGKAGVNAIRKEGFKEARWIALDFANIIVHIFHNETRNIYQLEKLWSDESNTTVYN